MPMVRWRALEAFDGQPWLEVLQRLQQDGVPIEADDVKQLLDFGILVDAASEDASAE